MSKIQKHNYKCKTPIDSQTQEKKYFFHFPVFFYESDFFILTVLNVFSKNQSPYMGLNEFFSNKNIPTLSKSKKKTRVSNFHEKHILFLLQILQQEL